MYAEDYDMLENFRQANQLANVRTLDVQIIELADDIAYAVHDLEDALSQGYFTIDELLYEMRIKDQSLKKFSDEECKLAEKELSMLVKNAQSRANKSSSHKNLQEYSQVFRKSLTSLLTSYFIHDIVLGHITESEAIEHSTIAGNRELKLDKSRPLCKILSKKIFKGVTRHSNIALYEERGAKVIENLFKLYNNKDVNKNGQLLPPDYRPKFEDGDDDDVKKKKYARAASDYIAGMMDTFAINTYENLFSTPFSSIQIL